VNIHVDYIPWEEVYIDPYHRRPDGSDARYIIRQVWMDRDEVKERWPGKSDEVNTGFTDTYEGQEKKAQMTAGSDRLGLTCYDKSSNRILLNECFYRESDDSLHYCLWSENVFFIGGERSANEWPYPPEVDCYPLVPIYCFKDSKGRPKGLVEYIRDMQDMLNKENSKFIWTISTNRVIAEEGAIKDPDSFRDEWNRPDGVVLLEDGGLVRVKSEDHVRESQHLLNHMNFLLMMIQRTSGVNDSLYGVGGTNERSAMQQVNRINQGNAMQTAIFENLYFSTKQACRCILKFIGAYYTDARVVRITKPNGQIDYMKVNQEVAPQEAGGEPVKINNINDILKYDVIMKPVQAYNSTREYALQVFSEVGKAGVFPPEILAEIMLSYSDMPNKQDILYRIQKFYDAQRAAQAAQMQAEMQANSLNQSGAAAAASPAQ
jgi:hypothetical protein